MRNMLIDAQTSHLIGHMNKHKANIEILLTHPVGIGEHQDIQTAIEDELEEIANYHDKLEMLIKYFPKTTEGESNEKSGTED
tara:strand:- start:9919 stop:10164 length:246 start_codon:yes stop_codon:yes gene_type:complete